MMDHNGVYTSLECEIGRDLAARVCDVTIDDYIARNS
jgi:hypothetical protein